MRERTYYPEQPSLHLEDRNHVSGIDNHVGHEEYSQAEGGVEVTAHQAK